MPVAFLLRYKTTKTGHIVSQLRGYLERELDRSPPRGFRVARILNDADGKTVAFYTEWDSAETLEDVRDSAPWEACMDLNEIHADGHEETVFEIA